MANDRHRAQSEADTACPDRLLTDHALASSNLLVDDPAGQATNPDRRKHDIGPAQPLGEICRRPDGQRWSGGGGALMVENRHHRGQPSCIGIHQHQLVDDAGAFRGVGE